MNPKTHVFAVAIESYQDANLPKVIYAESDAAMFQEAWQNLGVPAESSATLLGAQATKTAFQSRLKKFSQAVGSGDHVVFFYAGHGVSVDGEAFLTMFDTLSDDVEGTSIPVREVLKQLTTSKQVSVFLDVSHGELPSGTRAFSAGELQGFGQATAPGVAFVSTAQNEISGRNLKLRQGIWPYCLVSGLSGKAKEAATGEGLITSGSLQRYLEQEVPRQYRANSSDAGSQSPIAYGEMNEDFVIADLGSLSAHGESGASIRGARLVGGSQGRVRSLSGFAKFHKEPDSCSARFAQFVESLGAKEVEDRTTEIFDRVRTGFKYKRRDLFFDKEGAIKTPDFDVHVRLTQDAGTPNMYSLTNEVTVLRRPEVVSDPAFLDIFARYCNSVIIELGGALNIEAKIDDIEDVDALREHLEYDAECTEFTLRFPGTGMVMHATQDRLRFTLSGRGDLTTLIDGTQAALSHLSSASIVLGLPDKD